MAILWRVIPAIKETVVVPGKARHLQPLEVVLKSAAGFHFQNVGL